MNTFTKSFILFIVLILSSGYTALAQQSDYQIQQNFQAEYNELLERIDQASTSEGLEEIEQAINQLEEEYAEHQDLIDASSYPDTFEGAFANLRQNHASAVDRVTTIEELNEQIRQLEDEMQSVRSNLNELNQERVTLQEQIQEASENEARQAALIRQYRENIEERNLFVSNFLGELLSKYQSMDRAQQQEIAEAAGRLEENPVDVIQNVINEYINMMRQSTALEAPDYVSMKAQHGYFVEVWNSINGQLVNTFAPENPTQTQQEVDQLLSTWESTINENLWKSIRNSFSENGIELSQFNSSEEFYNALNRYLDNAIENSIDRNSEDDFEVYREFNNFWTNRVIGEWGEMLIEGNILTQEQISSVEMKLDNWRDEAIPTSNLTFILLIVSIAVIVGLIVLLLTRKSGDSTSTA